MNSLLVSGIALACVILGMVVGIVLRAILPERHLSSESKDVIKLGMGLIGTMTALVLGLVVASAKSAFDTQSNGVSQFAANVILLDRTLAHYGPEARAARELLNASIADTLQRTWPAENHESRRTRASSGTEGRYEALYDEIQELVPKNDSQRGLQAHALKVAADTAQLRWSLFAERDDSIPLPFLVVLVAWLALLFASFGLFAPPNATVIITLLICALTVSSSIFLILELDRAFAGIIHISSDPLRRALEQFGR
jgi:hypothetical protein